MVEVPAAALRAGQLAEVCDFLSIGTNDLAQYAFAADRMLGSLAELLDPWQPALLELVRQTAEAGAAHGRPVGVCGEAASDPLLALVLTGLGVTSLSAAPGCLSAVRAALAARTLEECRTLARPRAGGPGRDCGTYRGRGGDGRGGVAGNRTATGLLQRIAPYEPRPCRHADPGPAHPARVPCSASRPSL
ncbi:hypothetical protein NQP46_31660 [Streptomyces albus]|nr:hypothetical protein NQP46_31660 [Streptomyces albus]